MHTWPSGIATSLLFLTATASAQVHFDSCLSNTGSNATIIVDVLGGSHSFLQDSFAPGDEIAFFSEDGACVGVRSWSGGNLALTLWGDNPATAAKDGLYAGEDIHVRAWRAATDVEYGGAVGSISLSYVDSAPFLGAGAYYADGLYNLNQIVVSEEGAGGRNRISARNVKADAKETGKDRSGAFKIERSGSLNGDLAVYFAVEGTAENGIDYARVDSVATIQSGNAATYVVVDPLPDSGEEGAETVSIILLANPDYEIEAQYTVASLTIADGGFEVGTATDRISSDRVASDPDVFDAFPNPFADGISVDYVAHATDVVSVELFDALGRSVGIARQRSVVSGERYRFELSTRDLPGGVYFVRLMGRDETATRTVTRMK